MEGGKNMKREILILIIAITLLNLHAIFSTTAIDPPPQGQQAFYLKSGDFMYMEPTDELKFWWNLTHGPEGDYKWPRWHVALFIDNGTWVHSTAILRYWPGVSICNVPGFFINDYFWENFSYYSVDVSSYPGLRGKISELLTTAFWKETSWRQKGWLGYLYQYDWPRTSNNWNPNDNRIYANQFYCSEMFWAAYMNLTNGNFNIANISKVPGTETEWHGHITLKKLTDVDEVDIFPIHPLNAPFPEGT